MDVKIVIRMINCYNLYLYLGGGRLEKGEREEEYDECQSREVNLTRT